MNFSDVLDRLGRRYDYLEIKCFDDNDSEHSYVVIGDALYDSEEKYICDVKNDCHEIFDYSMDFAGARPLLKVWARHFNE